MKKFLLACAFFGAVSSANSQTVLNEVYSQPGGTNSEFFELYNSSLVGSQNVNCFTVLVYWQESASARGWYVIDLPNLNVASKGFFVGASTSPFSAQGSSGVIADFYWNDPNFLNGSTGGSLKKYQVSGTGYTDVSGTIPAGFNDLFPVVGLGGPTTTVLVYVNGALNNGFIGGGADGVLDMTATPNLSIDMDGACGDFTANFGAINALEFWNPAGGNDNGYARSSDGKCGAWIKTSSQVNHTPGVANGLAAGLAGELSIANFINCTSPRVATVRVTGVTGSATEADDFPVQIQAYEDENHDGQLDGGDTFIGSVMQNLITDPAQNIPLADQNADLIIVYKTQRGCFDRVVALATNCALLPVKFKSFTASRTNASTVGLTWTTSVEQNNYGFEIQRNTGNNVWQTVGFVTSQATNGNSLSDLTYNVSDLNNIRGISAYRIRQVDLDGKASYSEARTVRGEGQLSSVIVYPNPSSTGKITASFNDAAPRDISLVDISGRTIRTWNGYANNNLQIEIIAPGVYSLRIVVRETGEHSIQKIVINNR